MPEPQGRIGVRVEVEKSAVAVGLKGLAVTGGTPWRDDIRHPPEIGQIPNPSIGVGRQPVEILTGAAYGDDRESWANRFRHQIDAAVEIATVF